MEDGYTVLFRAGHTKAVLLHWLDGKTGTPANERTAFGAEMWAFSLVTLAQPLA